MRRRTRTACLAFTLGTLALLARGQNLTPLSPPPTVEQAAGQQSNLPELTLEQAVGRSSRIRAVLRDVELVAPTDSTVLIYGETGTGKELIARAIHERSPRNSKPFVKLNCAAIPTGLLESELFGHEKGAFTGAIMQRIGRFELANQGTAFLDEIGEVALEFRVPLAALGSHCVHEEETRGSTLKDAEREHIKSILKETNWLVSGPKGAAARLGMKRSTLNFRMKKLGIIRPLVQ
jgi:transcriptional regulator with GAF, ATPase, and Fis domain